MLNYEINLIWLPIIIGFVMFLLPRRLNIFSKLLGFLSLIFVFYYQILAFLSRPFEISNFFRVDNLNSFVLFFIGLFSLLIFIYSLKNMKNDEPLAKYFAYLLLTVGASNGVVLSKNFLYLLVFWGFLAITLYLMIGFRRPGAGFAVKKTLIIIGGSDAILLFGIVLLWYIAGSFDFDKISQALPTPHTVILTIAFLSISLACFAKAGAIPLHTWIPEIAEIAPTPVLAYLPASLDKLLGIYLLARVSFDILELKPGTGLSIYLLLIGAITVIAAVMMALIQHNLKKLLSYHAVSQVGYMVLGIGTLTPLGVAGGLFHMLNNAIYKACLFLSGGAVESRTKTSELDNLGGLAKFMPLTFIACIIASLSISGVPPFNGFFSKWMIYQALINQLTKTAFLTQVILMLCLVAAMFGSALTLASFLKLLHTVFLGQSEVTQDAEVKEASSYMWCPQLLLAGLCILFGVFAYQLPLRLFIQPAVGKSIIISGIWSPGLTTILIIIGLFVGIIIYKIMTAKVLRKDTSFVGGEIISPQLRPTGVEFYNTIRELPCLNKIYSLQEKKFFDIYEVKAKVVMYFSNLLSKLQTGLLPTYLSWLFLGFAIIGLIIILGG